MSEQVGKHKGAVETLLHEKKELSRLLQIVNSQLERHLSALDEAGVDTDQFIQEIQEQGQSHQKQGRQNKSQRNQRSKDRKQRSRGSNNKESSGKTEDRDFSPL